jgi:uncharacterized protein YdeI (YjbR/CyaY-like superfamily)
VSAPTDLPTLEIADQAAFEAWLERHHATAPGLYVKSAKKGAPEPSMTQAEMVESLLCYGWIDGRINRFDEFHFLTRVTPRRPASIWSQRNVELVAALTAAGRMRAAGLAAVEAARADGRWERAYAGAATATVPADLGAALAAEPAAQRAFETLDGANRYAVLWRVHTATSPTSRARRIAACVQMLAEGRRFH